MDETLTGMRIIRAFNATGFTLKKFSKENDFYRNASLQGFKRREMAPAFSEAAGVIVVAGILLYGGSLILQNGQTAAGIQASEFIAFIAIFSQVLRPAKAMVVAGANIQRGRAAGERILEIIDKPIEIKDKDDAAELNEFRHEIEFRNVDFSYSDMPVLKSVSFTIAKGKPVANAHDFIRQTENSYQTSIGDRGIRLSGGQRQRLCIARAVFKNPSILILDEATSALDTESERIVQDALGKLMKGRTTLVIAHRLSTIKEADEIIVLHEGQIIERGHHNELVEIEEGVYKKLTRMQQIA